MRKVRGITLGLTPQPVKSSYSATGNCVMVGSSVPTAVEVSDSKLDDSPAFIVSPAAWREMLRDVTGR
jgi:hypothetical protein